MQIEKTGTQVVATKDAAGTVTEVKVQETKNGKIVEKSSGPFPDRQEEKRNAG